MRELIEKVADNRLSDIGAERNLLACLTKTQEAWMRLPEDFNSDDLSASLNRSIFIVIDSLYASGAQVDPISVADRLPSDMQKELESIGGWGYLEALKELPIDPNNVELEARKLIELGTRRKIVEAGDKISSLAVDREDIDKVIEKVEVVVSEIEGRDGIEVNNIGSTALEFIEKKMAAPAEVPGLASGFPELDKSIQGFQEGRLYVVGARKKTGKSMILLNWAKNLGIEQGIPILWISTEHSQNDEFSRLLSLVSGVREVSINNGTFSDIPIHVERVQDAVDKIEASPFYFCSMPDFSLDKIRRVTRKYARVFGIKALFFDFIKTPEMDVSMKEWQELGRFSYGLKGLSMKENIPIISAVQINREGANTFKAEGEIDSDSFAGSDRIAQSVSVAMVLREPNKKEEEDRENYRVLRVTDNRHGLSSYKMLLNFSGDCIKMEELRRV